MGNGVCDFDKFTELLQITQTLVSYTSSTVYLTALTSIVSTNFMGMIGLMGYLQAYSTLYYLNSSMVMNVDYVLKEYRMVNINSYFQSQSSSSSASSSASKRMLVEFQNDKSLFLRDQPSIYLIEWAIIPAIVMALPWAISLTLFCLIKYCINKDKIHFNK